MSQLATKLKRFTMGMQDEGERLLAPLVPLPSPPRNDGLRFPARAIATAIIERALLDMGMFVDYHASRGRKIKPRHQREAYAWIVSRDTSHHMTFECLCEYLDFDAERIRLAAARIMTQGMI